MNRKITRLYSENSENGSLNKNIYQDGTISPYSSCYQDRLKLSSLRDNEFVFLTENK